VLWGDTAEEIWRPQGRCIVLLKECGGLGKVTVEQVMSGLGDILR
jgi:hypothetical protein